MPLCVYVCVDVIEGMCEFVSVSMRSRDREVHGDMAKVSERRT